MFAILIVIAIAVLIAIASWKYKLVTWPQTTPQVTPQVQSVEIAGWKRQPNTSRVLKNRLWKSGNMTLQEAAKLAATDNSCTMFEYDVVNKFANLYRFDNWRSNAEFGSQQTNGWDLYSRPITQRLIGNDWWAVEQGKKSALAPSTSSMVSLDQAALMCKQDSQCVMFSYNPSSIATFYKYLPTDSPALLTTLPGEQGTDLYIRGDF